MEDFGQPQTSRGKGTKGGQHFLLSAAARKLSVGQVARLDDDDAHRLFRGIRWCDTGGDPVCPACGCLAVYEHKSRRVYSCKACLKQFSITSGTMFHARKLPVRDVLLAIALFTNGAKGQSALHLGRDMNVSYKTAFVLLHKLREALGRESLDREASGVVEIDGAYFGKSKKQANWRENRVDRRRAENQNPKRQVVVVMRERGGRTLPFVVRREAQGAKVIERRVRTGSVVHADEARSWDPLHYAGLDLKRINHKEAYSDGEACTNAAESFFSRIRRAEIGMHHHVNGPYLRLYASEMAWREDARRIDNAVQFLMMGLAGFESPPSATFRGYWQRHRPKPVPPAVG